eukprot:scaffold5221_cov122-Isochrysis_galbana.AAC.7
MQVKWLLKYLDASTSTWKLILDCWLARTSLGRAAILSSIPAKVLTKSMRGNIALPQFWSQALEALRALALTQTSLSRDGMLSQPLWDNRHHPPPKIPTSSPGCSAQSAAGLRAGHRGAGCSRPPGYPRTPARTKSPPYTAIDCGAFSRGFLRFYKFFFVKRFLHGGAFSRLTLTLGDVGCWAFPPIVRLVGVLISRELVLVCLFIRGSLLSLGPGAEGRSHYLGVVARLYGCPPASRASSSG